MIQTLKAIIYISLSIFYSISIFYMNLYISKYDKIFADIIFYICVVGAFAYSYTNHCPFKIFANWCFNHHLNFLKMCKRCYGRRWLIASVIYFSSLFMYSLGTIYLLIKCLSN